MNSISDEQKDKDVEVELEDIEYEKSGAEALADMELEDLYVKYDKDKDKDKDEEVEVGVEATELEKSVAEALVDLELKDLHIKSAKQIDVPGNHRKAIVIHLPNRLRKALRTIEAKAIREVEKKLSSDVVFIASRSLNMPQKELLVCIRTGMMKDIVHPARHKATGGVRMPDGSQSITVYLDAEDRAETEYKLETYREVYKVLCDTEVFIRYWDFAMKKIEKNIREEPNDLEETVAQALYELEYTNEELKSDLKDLYIKSAEEIHVFQNRKAVVIQVPYRLRERFRKIHAKLVRELGNMLNGKEVIFISARKMSKKERMLEDIVYPAEIVGRHAPATNKRYGFTILLHPKDTEDKLLTFHQVYLDLIGEYVSFEYAA